MQLQQGDMSSYGNSIHILLLRDNIPQRKDTTKFTEHILKKVVVSKGESIKNIHKRLSMNALGGKGFNKGLPN